MLKKYSQVFRTLFICSDMLLLFFVWVFSYEATGYLRSGRHILAGGFLEHVRIFALMIPVFHFFAQRFEFYSPRRFSYYFSEFTKVLKVVSCACVIFFFLTYIAGILEYDYIFVLVFWGLSAALIFAYHSLVNFILKRSRARGFNLRKILIVGSGELAKQTASKFLTHQEFGLNVIGFLSSKNDITGGVPGCPILGRYEDLQQVVMKISPDIVFFALSPSEERLTHLLVEKINNEPVDIKIALDINGAFLLRNSVTEIDNIPVISLRESHLVGFSGVMKRAFDCLLSLATLIFSAPFFLLAAIFIKLSSPGPVFYIQERTSLDGKTLRLIKFRTMREDAEKEKGPVWAAENDPRRTRFGAWLRRTGFDELPQFINVLKGEMSIVGPRPERPEFITEFRKRYPNYMFRHAVRAGITGWAQVHGLRGNTPIEKRLEYDLYYINNSSFWLDMKILFLTIPAIFNGKGAC